MNTKLQSFKNLMLPLVILATGLFSVLILQFEGLNWMPGDLGDARLNNYFLENIFLFLNGKSDSLWNLSFFYPFPYVIGFSDNHFGSAPVYVFIRSFVDSPETSFQLWFLFGYVVNFASAHYALRKLGGGNLASAIGALIFAFALPTTAHAGHAQMHYRFGIPLAITFFICFLEKKNWKLLLCAAAWLVWQFYSGVYMGFFTLLFLAAALFSFIGYLLINKGLSFDVLKEFIHSWNIQSRFQKLLIIFGFSGLLLLLVLLFYPYFQVKELYGFSRGWGEIKEMLPRPQSYFLADTSLLWAVTDPSIFSKVPMRHEHQMFIGLGPLILAVIGCVIGFKSNKGLAYFLIVCMSALIILSTLYIGGYSIWYLFHKLPLASAIRVMTRLDQVLLFPVAYLSVLSLDILLNNKKFVLGGRILFLLFFAFIAYEFSNVSMPKSSKSVWQERLANAELKLINHGQLNPDSILFLAQEKNHPFYVSEIDAMLVSLKKNIKTLNGYSGNLPSSMHNLSFGKNCSEAKRRIYAYLYFLKKENDKEFFESLIKRIEPIGFSSCDFYQYSSSLPQITESDGVYSEKAFKLLSFTVDKYLRQNEEHYISLGIVNKGLENLSSTSMTNNTIRLSWRFLNSQGIPLSGWDTRKDLPSDIPANGKLSLDLFVPHDIKADKGFLEISLVQEGVFWAHDIGVAPAKLPLE